MTPELASLFDTVVKTLFQLATTDGWNAARSRFVKFVTRSKRREAESLLDATRGRIRENPQQGPEAVSGLIEELRPMLDTHVTLAHLEGFVSSILPLIEASKPTVTTYNAVADSQFIFYPGQRELVSVGESSAQSGALGEISTAEYIEMLRNTNRALTQSTEALKKSMAAQQVLTDKVIAQSRLLHESEQKAREARDTVLTLVILIAQLSQGLDRVSRERDGLLEQMHEAKGQQARFAALQQELTATQAEVVWWKARHDQAQQQLEVTRGQLRRAERLAEAALGDLAACESSTDAASSPQPDADAYEQLLDSIATAGKERQERLDEIEDELDELASPPAAEEQMPARQSEARADTASKPSAPAISVQTIPSQRTSSEPVSVRRNNPPASRGAATGVAGPLAAGAGAVAGVLAICLLIAFFVVKTVQDDQYSLLAMHLMGAKPVASTYTYPCIYTCTGTTEQDLTYALRPDSMVSTTFQVSDYKTRYFNTELSLQGASRSCGSTARVSYTVSSNGHIVSHGSVTWKNSASISDLPIGKHAQLGFTATLSAPSGCAISLDMSNPTVDALKGWSQLV